MKSEYRFKRFWGVFTVVLLAAVSLPGAKTADGGREGSFALILINTDNLACSPCLESLKAVCRAMPPAIQEKRMIGVLTYRDSDKPDPRRARIARTRWTGYSRANGILFPVSVDTGHAFNRFTDEGTTILLFDEAEECIRRWTAPFGADVFRDLAGFLAGTESATMDPGP